MISDVDRPHPVNDLLVTLLPLFNVQPDMHWGDWCHKCVCNKPAAPVHSTCKSLLY